jgi:hypothetical protein
MVGKKYEALKDFTKLYKLDFEFLPILVKMGEIWAYEVNNEKK